MLMLPVSRDLVRSADAGLRPGPGGPRSVLAGPPVVPLPLRASREPPWEGNAGLVQSGGGGSRRRERGRPGPGRTQKGPTRHVLRDRLTDELHLPVFKVVLLSSSAESKEVVVVYHLPRKFITGQLCGKNGVQMDRYQCI